MIDDPRSEAQGPIGGASPSERLPYRAVLTPHRSLSPRGFLLMMLLFGGVSFATGLLFASIGAWPILGFFGLDVAIVYVAFRLNYRSGRLYETVEVLPQTMSIERVHPSGEAERFEFQSYWARVLLSTGRDGRSKLSVASHGRDVTFGQFLTEDERAELAEELRAALRQARQPHAG